MAARFDKYDPISGGFRATVASDLADGSVGIPIGVGLDSSGRVVVGNGQTKIVGVIVDNGLMTGGTRKGAKAGTIIDVMTAGEIVDVASLVAGTAYYADPVTGALEVSAATDTKVGFTVEATRLIVRVGDEVV